MNIFSKRYIRKSYVRLLRYHGSPESIGRGTAIGLFTGFLIPFSLQMSVAFPMALIFKAAKLPALLFTWISNPITIPLIYPLQCFLGSYLIGRPFSYEAFKSASNIIIETPTLAHFLELGAEVALSFMAGGIIFGGISAIIGYFLTVNTVQSYRLKRKKRKAHFKALRLAKKQRI